MKTNFYLITILILGFLLSDGKVHAQDEDLTNYSPDREFACYLKAEEYFYQNEPERALSLLNEAISIKPEYRSCVLRARLYYQIKGDTANAIKDIEKALSMNKNMDEAYFHKAEITRGKRSYDKALPLYNKAIELAQKVEKEEGLAFPAFYYTARAKCYLQMKNKNAACQDLTKAVNLFDSEGETLKKANCK